MVAVMLVLGVLFVACATPTSTPTPTGTATPTASPTATPAKVIRIRITDTNAKVEDNVYYQMVLVLQSELDKAFPGRVKIEYYPEASLYAATPGNTAVLAGDVEACYSYPTLQEPLFGDTGHALAIFVLPGLIQTYEGFRYFTDDFYPTLAKEIIEPKGGIMKGLAYTWGGNYCASKPLPDFAAMKGKKIRVPPGSMGKALADNYFFNSVAMDTSEVIPAIQTGTVDGVQSSTPWLVRNKIAQVAKYWTVIQVPGTGSAGGFMWNKAFYDGLPADIKDKLEKEIWPKVNQKAYEVQIPMIGDYEKLMEAQGGIMQKWDAANMALAAKANEGVWKTMRPIIGDKWMDYAIKLADTYNKKYPMK